MSCAADWADCNNDKTSCETQLGTTQNCTGCGQSCALANAVPSCAGSAGAHSCAISSCTQSYYADCDTTPGDGCEIDKRSSTANCGSCGNNCAMHANVQSASCGSGVCNYTCKNGFGNCTSAAGCETPLTTLTDCGGCGVSCARTNGSASCGTGTCTLSGCNTGYRIATAARPTAASRSPHSRTAACCTTVLAHQRHGQLQHRKLHAHRLQLRLRRLRQQSGNGCETPTNTNSNCGGCGTTCSRTNGTASCSTGTCTLTGCNSGYGDCDSNTGNGCETPTHQQQLRRCG